MNDLLRVRDLPPTTKRSPYKVDWDAVVREARAYPDEWVLVPEILHVSVASNIRRGQYKAVPPDEFVVTTRQAEGEPKGRVSIYVKVR